MSFEPVSGSEIAKRAAGVMVNTLVFRLYASLRVYREGNNRADVFIDASLTRYEQLSGLTDEKCDYEY